MWEQRTFSYDAPWVGGTLKFTSETDAENSQLLVTVVYEVVLHLNKCPLEEVKYEHKIKMYVIRDTLC